MRQMHAPVCEGLLRALSDIFVGGYPADKVIQRQLKFNKRWGSHDRRIVAEGVYDIVRWWRRLLFACGYEWPVEDRWSDPSVFPAVLQAWCLLNEVELGKNIPRLALPDVRARFHDPQLPRAVRESVPDWLDQWGYAQLQERWGSVLPVLNTSAPVYLRANRLKTTPEKLVRDLAREKIEATLVDGDAVKLKNRANVWLTRIFKDGHFEVQDWSSQQAALALAPQAGERVIDACAGAGGKSLHMAALMGNKGRIIAMDVGEKKLEQLRERAKRGGASCIEARLIDSTKVIKRQAESADRLLLDVPCTGLGVLRRNPDSKWKLSLADVAQVKKLQTDILAGYPQMLKPGGRLVYATCSIAPEENGEQVRAFLSRNETAYQLEKEETYWPQTGGHDGFYVAVISKQS
ncbi:MAG: RsmB/NOP family class I SAM-dependent RNA methyltransferase [Bdellovibrionales bacterium]|nr:RsmB/NOP family class I SAM-dependent RNA methyltransferase [Bdellovibrionales bacterium]